MARKRISLPRESSLVKDTSSSSSKNHVAPDQSTLTQMDFSMVIDDSEEDEPVIIAPRKRRKQTEQSRSAPKRQNTLTQMDFVSIDEDLLEIYGSYKTSPSKVAKLELDSNQVIPNSSNAESNYQPIIEAPVGSIKQNSKDLAKDNATVPQPILYNVMAITDAISPLAPPLICTPKRPRPEIVPSSQTPTTTPITIDRSPTKQSSPPIPESPTPTQRKVARLSSPKPDRNTKDFSPKSPLQQFSTQHETQLSQSQNRQETQISPSTRKRLDAWNSRWEQLSRENSTKSSNHQQPQSQVYNESIGDETQDALFEAAKETESGGYQSGIEETVSPPKSILGVEKSFEIPRAGEEGSVTDEILPHQSTQETQGDIVGEEAQEQLYPRPSQAPTEPHSSSRSQSPLKSSQPNTGFKVPPHPIAYSQKAGYFLDEDENSLPYGEISGPEQSKPLTISQLIPSSLMNSDVPLPPRWDDELDDL